MNVRPCEVNLSPRFTGYLFVVRENHELGLLYNFYTLPQLRKQMKEMNSLSRMAG